jgi:hypothetical protein
VASEPGRDPGEQAAYDVARILVSYPALRRVVEIAAMARVRPVPQVDGPAAADREGAVDAPVPPRLRVRPA